MRDAYHCPYCDQRSTRRWNLDIHIKRRHGGSPDPHLASHPTHPFSYKPSNPYYNIESTTVAYNGWNSFQPRYGHQQAPVGISQCSSSPIYPSRQIMDNQNYGTSLPQSAIQKIQELKALMNKYPKYHNNPDDVIRWAIYNSINGDYTLLDNKLDQLRTIDRRLNAWS